MVYSAGSLGASCFGRGPEINANRCEAKCELSKPAKGSPCSDRVLDAAASGALTGCMEAKLGFKDAE